ncbi:MAG TPA: NADPH:quinone oxidoreductase family protein [Thermoleophilaceae bacterium]|nr:NADPH:quinone oxidoreductase family protein [Thermoleophilaceae bacterium]
MRAVQVSELTGPAAVRVVEVDEPVADGQSLLVDVKAAGVSFPELLQTRGEYQLKLDPPFVLGSELSGVVRDAPDGSGFAPGDRITALAPLGGAFAEVALAPPFAAFKLPDALDFGQGAGYCMNYHTAHFALARRAALGEGETLLVHGAAGGTGTAAIQVGKGLGARVVAVVSTDEKERVARAAGADEVVRSDGDWRKEAGPANVIFDPVGGSRFDESVRALAPEGRLVVIGFTEGAIPSVSVNRLLFRNVSVVGAGWEHFAFERPQYLREVAADLDRMVAAGHVAPIVGRRYPLEGVREALEDLDGRRAVGKLVLDVDQEAA